MEIRTLATKYQCLQCRREDSGPLEMHECAKGCGGIFCSGCLAEHEKACGDAGKPPRDTNTLFGFPLRPAWAG